MERKKIVLVIALGAAILLFYQLGLHRSLTLAALKAHRHELLAFYASHRIGTILLFMALYVTVTALSLPGAAVLSLAAGALLGPLIGTACAVTAAAVGATLAFLATRYLFRETVSSRFGSRLDALNRELEERGFSYLLFLRLIPFFPFFLINLAAGLTRLPVRTFAAATAIGIIPGGFVYVNAGASLASISSLSGIATPRVVGSLVLLALFALVPAAHARLKKGRP